MWDFWYALWNYIHPMGHDQNFYISHSQGYPGKLNKCPTFSNATKKYFSGGKENMFTEKQGVSLYL